MDLRQRGDANLVLGYHKCTDQTSDDHDLINEKRVKYSGPWHASSQEQVHEQKRSGDDPVRPKSAA